MDVTESPTKPKESPEKPNISSFLTPQKCESAGVTPLSMSEGKVVLGAMNPYFSEVKKIIAELNKRFSLEVDVKSISADEFEKWVDQPLSDDIHLKIEPLPNEVAIEENISQDPDPSYINNLNSTSKKGNAISSRELVQEKKIELNQTSIKEKNIEVNQASIKEKDIALKEPNEKNKSDSLLNELAPDSGVDKIDNFEIDFEDEEEDNSELEGDIIEDSEYLGSDDPIVSAVGSILSACGRLKASDIHAEPLEDRMRIRYRIDGVLKEIYSLPKAKSRAITSRLKVMSRLDIAEKRIPQDGRIRCRINNIISDFRVSTLPGKWGEKIVLRALQSDSGMLDLEKLISFPEELQLVRDMGSSPYGILIVVGPTGSGKSTTLFSILNERNTPDVNISTVEDPVEYTLDGLHQVQVIREKGLDFSRALRSLMRQDPDIILVGETRDKETAQTAMEAALTGHMVFTTLHANDTATAITRLAEMGIPPYLVGSSVIGVLAQRLIRKVCTKCSTVIKVDPEKHKTAHAHGITEIKKAKIVDIAKQSLKDSNLCSVCNGTGYKGRLGLYEVMKVNDPIRNHIMKASTADVIREAAVSNGLRTLLEYGLDLVKQKLTTIEEVERVCLMEENTDD